MLLSTLAQRIFSNTGDFISWNSNPRGTEHILYLINEALNIAATSHAFTDLLESVSVARTQGEDLTDLECRQFTIDSNIDIAYVLSVSLVRDNNKYNIKIKDKRWWGINVEGLSNSGKEGLPAYGVKKGNVIELSSQARDDDTLHVMYTRIPSVAATGNFEGIFEPDALAPFVIQYVTAMAFLRREDTVKYKEWYAMALGYQYANSKIGGTLRRLIEADISNTVKDNYAEPKHNFGNSRFPTVESILGKPIALSSINTLEDTVILH